MPDLDFMLTWLGERGLVSLETGRPGTWVCAFEPHRSTAEMHAGHRQPTPREAVYEVYKAVQDASFAAFLAAGGTND